METVHRLELPLKLDQLTEGLGNCFPISIVQQCHRPEILSYLRPKANQIVRLRNGHSTLRQNVTEFIMKSKTLRVQSFKKQFDETDGVVNRESWCQYWVRMKTDKTWVDYWFVQATAWYLQLDIWIVATSSTESSPYIVISGNLGDGSCPSDGPIITLGTKSNSHYQSLLPIEMLHLEFEQNQHNQVQELTVARQNFNQLNNDKKIVYSREYPDNILADQEQNELEHRGKKNTQTKQNSSDDNTNSNLTVKKTSQQDNKRNNIEATTEEVPEKQASQTTDDLAFVFESSGQVSAFLKMSDDFVMRCPQCQLKTKYIVKHLGASKMCNKNIDIEAFKYQFKIYKRDKAKRDHVKHQRVYREKIMKLDKIKAKRDNAEHQRIH